MDVPCYDCRAEIDTYHHPAWRHLYEQGPVIGFPGGLGFGASFLHRLESMILLN